MFDKINGIIEKVENNNPEEQLEHRTNKKQVILRPVQEIPMRESIL